MKTLNTIITLSLIAIGTAGFAKEYDHSDKNLRVPAAPSVWEAAPIEAPIELEYVKAKSALVPVAGFEWGSPSEIPAELLVVPVAPKDMYNQLDSIPENLQYIKAKNAFVPVAPFAFGNSDVDAPQGLGY